MKKWFHVFEKCDFCQKIEEVWDYSQYWQLLIQGRDDIFIRTDDDLLYDELTDDWQFFEEYFACVFKIKTFVSHFEDQFKCCISIYLLARHIDLILLMMVFSWAFKLLAMMIFKSNGFCSFFTMSNISF